MMLGVGRREIQILALAALQYRWLTAGSKQLGKRPRSQLFRPVADILVIHSSCVTEAVVSDMKLD